MNVRIFSVGNKYGFVPVLLTGHRGSIVGAYFTEDDHSVVSVAEDGAVFVWEWKPVSDEEWEKQMRYQKYVKRGKNLKAGKKSSMEEEKEEGKEEEKEKEEKEEEEKEESESESESEEKEGSESDKEEEEEEEKEEKEKEEEKEDNENENEEEDPKEPPVSESEDESQSEFPTSIYAHGKWAIKDRHYLGETYSTTSCDFNSRTHLLIIGLSNGVFSLYEMPDFNLIHTLSISNRSISSCAINRSGDWLAFGCATLGQLLVWEWQSETYVLKQQGHYHNIGALEFSPDGSVVATGGDDGKIKLWSMTSGFCYVTFSEHTAAVTDLCYVRGGHAIVSASLDGTVRAFDLVRYRNFRTLTTPTPVQFTCVTCDASSWIERNHV